MKNPKVNRFIGYVILFVGFFFFYKGFHANTALDSVNGYDAKLVGIAVILMLVSFGWMLMKVRCPHCGQLLDLKLNNISVCPYCGKMTDGKNDDSEE